PEATARLHGAFDSLAPRPTDVLRQEGREGELDEVVEVGAEGGETRVDGARIELRAELDALAPFGPEVRVAEAGEVEVAERRRAERLAKARAQPRAGTERHHDSAAHARLGTERGVVVVAQPEVGAEPVSPPAELGEGRF